MVLHLKCHFVSCSDWRVLCLRVEFKSFIFLVMRSWASCPFLFYYNWNFWILCVFFGWPFLPNPILICYLLLIILEKVLNFKIIATTLNLHDEKCFYIINLFSIRMCVWHKSNDILIVHLTSCPYKTSNAHMPLSLRHIN